MKKLFDAIFVQATKSTYDKNIRDFFYLLAISINMEDYANAANTNEITVSEVREFYYICTVFKYSALRPFQNCSPFLHTLTGSFFTSLHLFHDTRSVKNACCFPNLSVCASG
ncbi:hypothetical protein VCUG_02662 [Vavraia culicis subsp. floridensis]|uniref:Uncharacterized protein n=1 Tax=Vavraia culicis (isolate floridensis) TaxID=948595 RepID=L2GQB1_VAVCU|nr:uncharacterized protein VCUG_02662 [Vavraia culicis subsp. floridensis]ELA45851.1 hypothetical protein VCUG_02662 [Vavraia culicis subsp. floridensis]